MSRASMVPSGVRRHIMEAPNDELVKYIQQRDRINDEFMYAQGELLCRCLRMLEEAEIAGRDRSKDRKVPARKQNGSGSEKA